MPIYLVRWPDLSAALVKAGSEDELVELLDEIDNPDGCTWSVYRGPLFLDFSLPVRFDVKERPGPVRQEDITVQDVSGLLEDRCLNVKVADCETGADMSAAIERQVFPTVYKARHEREEEPTEAEMRQAVYAELQALVRAHERVEAAGLGDREGLLAAYTGAPARLVRKWSDLAAEIAGRPVEASPAKRPKKRRR